jgi:transmembrane sensor
MDNSRFTWLFHRYRSGEATPTEQEEYFSLIAAAEYDEQLQELLNDAWESFEPGVPTLLPAQRRNMWQQVQDAAGIPTKEKRIWWPYWAAAASLLLLLGIGGYFRYGQAPPQVIMAKHTADILPGSNKAMLTLANGTVVPLDSAGNQVIAQGAVNIRQQQGQLLYAANNHTTALEYNTLTTPRGGKFRIQLPDGSVVWLNAASSLKYPTTFNSKERIVELRGQGYFEIATDAIRPFKVKVNDMEVQVLGTAFDIMAYAEEGTVNTTLLQGGVKVIKGKETQVLKPGQQAVAAAHNASITVQEANVNQVIAWKNDRFIFNDTDLETILREVSRWYDVQIVYTIKPGKEKYNGGLSRHLPLSVVLQLLEDNGNNHFKTDGPKIIVLPGEQGTMKK